MISTSGIVVKSCYELRVHTNAADIAMFMRMSLTVDLENLQDNLITDY